MSKTKFQLFFMLLLFIAGKGFSTITWTNMIPQTKEPVMEYTLQISDSLIGIDETQTVYLRDSVSNTWEVINSNELATPYLDKGIYIHKSGTISFRTADRFYLSHDFGKEWKISSKIISDFHKLSSTDYIGYEEKELLHSNDGITWSVVATVENRITQVIPVDESFLLALIDHDSLYSSSDSGKTWSFYKNIPVGIDSILSVTDSTCLVNFYYPGEFAVTSDTFTTFTSIHSYTSDFVYNDSLVTVSTHNSTIMVLPANESEWTSVSFTLMNDIKTMYRWKDTLFADGVNNEHLYSTDNGITWIDPILNFNTIVGIDFIDSLTGFLLSGNDIYKTTDCGVTWQRHSTIDPGGDEMFAFDMYDENNGFIVGEMSKAFHMSDGSTWRERKMASNYLDLNDVLLCSSDEWYIVGERGTILSSSDMGQNWNYITDISKQQPSGIAVDTFYHSTWISGFDGILYKGDSKGENWKEVTGSDDFNFSGISFYNSQCGIAIGANNVFTTGKTRYVQTSDGGETWNQKEIQGTSMEYNKFSDVLYTDSANMYFFGNASFESHDGGVTWSNSNLPGAISNVENYGSAGIWAFGENTLLKADTLFQVSVSPSTPKQAHLSSPALQTNRPDRIRLMNIPAGVENVKVGIYSLNGRNIASYHFHKQSNYTVPHSLGSGIYICKIAFDRKQFSIPFWVE